MKKVTIMLSIILWALPCVTLASDYFLAAPGQVQTLAGKMTVGDESVSLTKTVTVLTPDEVKDAPEGAILLHVATEADGKESEGVSCFEKREDGYYLVAQAKAKGKKCKPVKKESRELPIPLVEGATWTTVTEEKGEMTLNWSVVELNEETGVAHLHAEGEAKVMGLTVPIRRDSWIRPNGEKIKEELFQTIMGQKTVTMLEATERKTGGESES